MHWCTSYYCRQTLSTFLALHLHLLLSLPWHLLQAYFVQFGPIQESVIMKDRYTGKSRGFGFVTFMNADDASQVVTAEHHVDGE